MFLQTVEHVERAAAAAASASRRCWRPGGVAYVSTPNRLTLAAPGAAKSGNPWHVREYTPAEYRAVLEPRFSRVDLLGVFHARKLRAHELALRLGWDRVHPALRLTRPFYDRFVPAIDERDFAVRDGRARPRARPARGVPAMSSGRRPIAASSRSSCTPRIPAVEPSGDELEDSLRSRQVFKALLAKVAQTLLGREVVLDDVTRGSRTGGSARHGRQPRCGRRGGSRARRSPSDGGGLAGVHADPNTHVPPVRPRL